MPEGDEPRAASDEPRRRRATPMARAVARQRKRERKRGRRRFLRMDAACVVTHAFTDPKMCAVKIVFSGCP